ncbi:MAG TPA: Trk system potassium transporter TrkA, partial [Deltaproteobacteria bacterium]|nr:Trk system potassium transporter TrkA [Deltaproteobacteria bacterium]
MAKRHFAVMGAGEVGCHLARTLSAEGHRVTLIDNNPDKRRLVEDQLDVGFVLGNGSHMPTLEAADVASCELFVAASSQDEANLAASLLAKRVGAQKTVVRVSKSEDVTRYSEIYESAFEADLLLSTQLLTTTRILNSVLGYNTLEVEYLAGGAIQVRTIRVEADSPLHKKRLADIDLPRGSLILAFISHGQVRVPSGNDHAEPGDDALILGMSDVIDEVERRVSRDAQRIGQVVIAGGGETAEAVAAGLERSTNSIRIIESSRSRAEDLAARYPQYDIVHGDATDSSVLASERVQKARAFIALTGHDEKNLMACLLAQELGVPKITALVQKTETSSLWRKVGLVDVISPRTIAAERISNYIANHYEPHILSF